MASVYAYELQSNKDKIMKLKANLALAKQNKDYVRFNEIALELQKIINSLDFRKSRTKDMIRGKIQYEAKQMYLYENLDINIGNVIKKKEFILKKLIDDEKLLLSLSMTEIRNLEDKLGNIYVEWNDE
jgi:hypothetical protein